MVFVNSEHSIGHSPEWHEEVRVDRNNSTVVFVCDECNTIRIVGDWPYCPHESGHFGEEPLEPYFDEHITERGEQITSRGQRRKIMDQCHLEFRRKRTDLITGLKRYFDMSRKTG